jgi:outer membrane protein TolC
MALTGCHKPYIMTQLDYSYYNAVTPETNAPKQEDIDQLTAGGTPRSVADPTEKKDWELSLEDCKRIALQNNKRIAFLGYEPGVQGTQIQTALARFDATVEAGAQWAYSDTPLTNTIQVFGTNATAVNTKSFGTSAGGFGSSTTDGGATTDFATTLPGQNLMSIFKRHATGGLTRIAYDIDYQNLDPAGAFIAINPSWRSTVTARLEQPLLQGAGVEFNRAPILIARATHEQSIKTFEDEVQKLMRDVELAYWDLYFKFQELYSREAGLEQALATWRIERNKEIYGKSTAADVAQAREQLELFRAQRLVSLNDLLNNERKLRELMGIAPDDDLRIIPKDEPTFARYEPDWQIAVSESMQFKPDLQAQRFQVRAAELEVIRQRNGLLPDLTVGGSWSLVGLDNQWDQSIDRLTDADFETWTLFVRARRQIGERAANAAVRRAQLVLSQRRGELRNLEHTAIHSLAQQYQRIISNYQLIQAQKDRRQAAADQLQAREDIYREGVATIDLLLQAQSRFAEALRDESQAVVDYNKALAEWEYARGRTLANDNIVLAEQRISLASPKLRRDRAKWMENSIPLPIHPGSKVHAAPGCPEDNRPLYPADIAPTSTKSPTTMSVVPAEESVPPIADPMPAANSSPTGDAPTNSTEPPPQLPSPN